MGSCGVGGVNKGRGVVSVILCGGGSADAVVAGYHVYRSVVDGGYEQISAALVLGTTYTDNTVHNGLQYYYNVKAVTPAGLKSQASAPAMAIPHYTIGWANLQWPCLLYTSDAADERSSVDLGGRRIIKKKKIVQHYVDVGAEDEQRPT